MTETVQTAYLKNVIKAYVLATFKAHNNHVVKTAGALGLSPKTVYTMLNRWGMKLKRGRPKKVEALANPGEDVAATIESSIATENNRENLESHDVDVTGFLATKKPNLKRARIRKRSKRSRGK